jgi:hypothetical protein
MSYRQDADSSEVRCNSRVGIVGEGKGHNVMGISDAAVIAVNSP